MRRSANFAGAQLLILCVSFCFYSCEKSIEIGSKKQKVDLIPIDCPTNNTTEYPYRNSTDRWLPQKFFNLGNYENHTHRPWRMLFNQNVQSVQYRFQEFETEQHLDYLNVTTMYGVVPYNGRSSQSHTNAPPTNGPFASHIWPLGGGATTAYLDFLWHTNDVYNYQGYDIDKI